MKLKFSPRAHGGKTKGANSLAHLSVAPALIRDRVCAHNVFLCGLYAPGVQAGLAR